MAIDQVAAGGFASAAGISAPARPRYARAAIGAAKSILGSGSTVLDLAAGTGILTGQLLRAGLAPIAVEPLPAMLGHLRSSLPSVPCALGVAEALLLGDASVQGCAIGRAPHWFDAPEALSEIARVLVDDAALVILFNARDDSVQWVRELTDLVEAHTGGRPCDDHRAAPWSAVVAESGGFTDAVEHRFDNPVPTTRDGVIDRLRSTSCVAALPEPARQQLVAEARGLLATEPGLDGTFDDPQRTRLFVVRRVPR